MRGNFAARFSTCRHVRFRQKLGPQPASKRTTGYRKVIEGKINSLHTTDAALEDRAMQGRNSSASVAVQTAGKAASKQPAGSAILPVQAKGEKSQGVLGDRAPRFQTEGRADGAYIIPVIRTILVATHITNRKNEPKRLYMQRSIRAR
jgi:hypothetical protein